MELLLLAAILWVAVHIGLSGTKLRGQVVARLGENGFRILFSLLSAGTLMLLVVAYSRAGTTPLWTAPGWLRWLLALLMLPAFVLFVASFRRNPTAMGGEAFAAAEPRGIQRITRHPMMVAFTTWAAVHVVGNGDTASLLFFGAFLVTTLAGMPSIDAKLAARAPDAWARLAATTSILPFGAILAGRNRLVLSEIGWVVPAIGLVAWAAMLYFHQAIFGAAPVAMG